jgi:sec-independent protein translocase protein TatC
MIGLRRRRTARPDGRMTIVEHLEELRHRILLSFLAFVVGSIVAYVLYGRLFDLLVSPLDKGGRIGGVAVRDLNVPGITTAFVLKLKVSVFFGLVFALPVVLWQLWRFIVPGLQPRERRFGVWFVLSSLGLFALGAFFAFLVLPQAIGFLLSFANIPHLRPLILVNEYISFVSFMVLAFGISFEFPLLLLFLAGIGVIDSRRLSSWRRQAIFAAFVIGAVATPSQDPYSMTLLAAPLYILYEVSVLVIRYVMRK